MPAQRKEKAPRKKRSLVSAAFNVGIVAVGLYRWAGETVALFRYEARLARKSLFVLAGLMILTLCLVMTAWISLLALFGFWLVVINQWTFLSCLSLIFFLNLVLMGLTWIFIRRAKRNLLFRRTRRKISEY